MGPASPAGGAARLRGGRSRLNPRAFQRHATASARRATSTWHKSYRCPVKTEPAMTAIHNDDHAETRLRRNAMTEMNRDEGGA